LIRVSQKIDRRTVYLAGRLTIAQESEFLEACACSTSLALDLTDLMSADDVGIGMLQRVVQEGATLVGVAPYIQLKMASSTPWPTERPALKRGSK
jgi:anti-anti-sigma regulatory factor